MGKPLRNIELLFVLRREHHAEPFSICLRIRAQVHCHIKHSSPDRAHQLALGILFLEMQASQHAFHGHGLVVLDKYHIQSRFPEIVLIISFHKISPLVLKNSWLNHI